jgi:predicted aspartyl protease
MNDPFPYDADYTPPAPVLPIRVVTPGKRSKSETTRSHRMRGLLGHSTPVDVYGVTIEIAGHSFKQIRVIAVRDNAEEPILGRNVLNQLVLRADGPEKHSISRLNHSLQVLVPLAAE